MEIVCFSLDTDESMRMELQVRGLLPHTKGFFLYQPSHSIVCQSLRASVGTNLWRTYACRPMGATFCKAVTHLHSGLTALRVGGCDLFGEQA